LRRLNLISAIAFGFKFLNPWRWKIDNEFWRVYPHAVISYRRRLKSEVAIGLLNQAESVSHRLSGINDREMKRPLRKLNFDRSRRMDRRDRGLSGTFHFFFGIVVFAFLSAGCAHFQPAPLSPNRTADAFNDRSFDDKRLHDFLETNHVAAPGPGEGWNLDQLTLVAFYYQPALAEARAKLAVSRASVTTAGQRPNPSVSATPGYDAGIPGNPSPWLVTLSTDWPIETAGKRGKRIAEAEYLAEAERWNLIGAAWQARSRVRSALIGLYAARETEASLARQTAAQSNVVRLLQEQLAAGNISGYEVTQARVALDTARLQWQESAGQYNVALADMANALGVPISALEGVEFSFAGLDQFPRNLTSAEARRAALLNRTDVRAALAQYAASQAALQLEIANQYPDLRIGPGYAWNAGSAGDNEWNVGVSLTLPIMNHNQGPVAEAMARRTQAAAHFLAVQANAIGEINSALAAYDAASQQFATAKKLLENLQIRLNSVGSQEKAGEADALTMANAEVEFGTGAQSRIVAVIKAQQTLGQLEDAVQSPLTVRPDTLQAAEKDMAR
jgi:outer membrane protein TolC